MFIRVDTNVGLKRAYAEGRHVSGVVARPVSARSIVHRQPTLAAFIALGAIIAALAAYAVSQRRTIAQLRHEVGILRDANRSR